MEKSAENVTFATTVPPDLAEKIIVAADKENRPISNLIRVILQEAIDKRLKKV